MNRSKEIRIIVKGDGACFTQPQFKSERVTYDVPTPGALEGMLKQIYWKPAMRYVIDRIIVFNPIKTQTITRRELKDKVSARKVASQMQGKPVRMDFERTLRTTTYLTDVQYGIEFHIELTGIKNERESEECNAVRKHYSMFLHRATKGHYFSEPYFGCREFVVTGLEVVDEFDESEIDREIIEDGDVDLRRMSYGVQFEDKGRPSNGNWECPEFSDNAKTIYYHPHMVNGIIDVEKYRREIEC